MYYCIICMCIYIYIYRAHEVKLNQETSAWPHLLEAQIIQAASTAPSSH